MANNINDITNATKLRQMIRHAKTAEDAQAAMDQLEAITPEKNQAGLKGDRTATANQVRKLGRTSQPASSSGKGTDSPSLKDTKERDLRKAAFDNADPEAFKELERRGRANGSDRRRFKDAQATAQKEGGSSDGSSTPPKPVKRRRFGGWVERMMGDVPESKKEYVGEKIEHTVEDLTKRGTPEHVAKRVAQQYLDESLARARDPNEQAWIEKYEKRMQEQRDRER